MDITTKTISGFTCVDLSGDLDVYSMGVFREDMSSLIDGLKDKPLLMDFENLRYIDSSGLGALIALIKKSRYMGGNIRIFNINEDVNKILQLTRIHKYIKPYTDLQSAVSET